MLYRPLFFTSFMLADFLTGGGTASAQTVVLSSASSKTAYGTAFLLRAAGVRTVGLTSARNVEFTTSLDVYAEVMAYGDVSSLERVRAAYVDCAGSTPLRAALHDHLDSALVADVVVGVTHQDSTPAGTLAGARPAVFFAPDQMRKRTGDWAATASTTASRRPGGRSCPPSRGGSTSPSATARRRSGTCGSRCCRGAAPRAPGTSSALIPH